jgi:hypothetical protein
MKRVKNILPKKADLDARVRGDALGVAADWRSLEALAEATRKRYEEDGSDDAKARYLKVIEAMLPVVGVEDAERFRKRHHELVARLAPGSLAERALGEVPSLGPAPGLRELAERVQLDGYQAPEEDPEHESPWIEPDEPRKTSGTPRIHAGGAEAA